MVIAVLPNGTLEFVYHDDFAELVRDGMATGKATVVRASRVEPLQSGEWAADLFLGNGPVLGPFPLRAEAIAAEVDWIEQHRLGFTEGRS